MSQPNQIVLTVNSVSENYDLEQRFDTRTVFNGPDHSFVTPDTLTLYRTLPARAGNFNGVVKSQAKFSKGYSVAGYDDTTNVRAAAILQVNGSIPVGTPDAEVDEMIDRMISWLGSAEGRMHIKKGTI